MSQLNEASETGSVVRPDVATFETADPDLRYGSWHERPGLRAAVLRNKVLSCFACAAGALLVLMLGVALGGTRGPLQRPLSLCSGGHNGTLRRLSREAFEYWASVNEPPTDSLVIMVGDGYGPDYHTMARSMRRAQTGNASAMLPLDPFLLGGSITSASSNIITDSAAGATAYASAVKTFNGALGVAETDGKWSRICGDSFGGSLPAACNASSGEACCPVRRFANTLEGCRARGMATAQILKKYSIW